MKGARETVIALKMKGYKLILLSAGISILANRLVKELNLDYAYANELCIDGDGFLTGEGIEKVGLLKKDKAFERIIDNFGISSNECIVVGDSKYDTPVFKKAGFSIAFNTTDEQVISRANCYVKEKDLTKILQYIP